MTPIPLTERWETSGGMVAAARIGTGRPLVLAHGWPWSSQAWHRVMPHLAPHFRVHLYDMPGYGASQMNHGPTDLGVQSRVFAEMMTHWGLEAPAVWAHDMGGATVLRAHLLHGVPLGRLVLMNVVAMRPWGSDFFDHVARHNEAFRAVPDHIHAGIVHAYIGGALARSLPAGDAEMLAAPWLSPEGKASFYAQFAAADESLTAAFKPHLGEIAAPTAVLWGTDDPWIPLERGVGLAKSIGADLTPLPGLGHLPQLESPARALCAALPHLES